jgi:predicted DCC family thiol-disulfide oxidoreductase YuxK
MPRIFPREYLDTVNEHRIYILIVQKSCLWQLNVTYIKIHTETIGGATRLAWWTALLQQILGNAVLRHMRRHRRIKMTPMQWGNPTTGLLPT